MKTFNSFCESYEKKICDGSPPPTYINFRHVLKLLFERAILLFLFVFF